MDTYDAVSECQAQSSCLGIAMFAGNNGFLKIETANDVTGYQWEDKTTMISAKVI